MDLGLIRSKDKKYNILSTITLDLWLKPETLNFKDTNY